MRGVDLVCEPTLRLKRSILIRNRHPHIFCKTFEPTCLTSPLYITIPFKLDNLNVESIRGLSQSLCFQGLALLLLQGVTLEVDCGRGKVLDPHSKVLDLSISENDAVGLDTSD